MSEQQIDRYERGYAILRTDHEPRDRGHPVRVVEVVRELSEADAEVARLTAIGGSRTTSYEWQVTHILPPAQPSDRATSAAVELLTSAAPPWIVVSPGLETTTLAARLPASSTVRVLRGRKMTTRQGVFNETAAALQFPPHFGENWDAYEEFLRDLSWVPAAAYTIAIADAEQLLASESGGQLATFLDILHETATSWGTPVEAGRPTDRPAVPFHFLIACAVGHAHDVLRSRLAAIGREPPVLGDNSWRA